MNLRNQNKEFCQKTSNKNSSFVINNYPIKMANRVSITYKERSTPSIFGRSPDCNTVRDYSKLVLCHRNIIEISENLENDFIGCLQEFFNDFTPKIFYAPQYNTLEYIIRYKYKQVCSFRIHGDPRTFTRDLRPYSYRFCYRFHYN
jgi:hypothetical protein